MTHTLHRYGDSNSFDDDYVLFVIPAMGKNDEGSVEKLRTFLRICAAHKPVNMGNGEFGAYRFGQGDKPMPDYESVIAGASRPMTMAAVFESREKAEAAMRDVIKADLGLSVNLSTSVDRAHECCRNTGLKRHSVEYSLGFLDRHNHLPNRQALGLSTMCGHSLVSNAFAEKMIAEVKENRRTTEDAAAHLACFCLCGIYNPARAKRLLEEARRGNRA